MLRVCMCSRKRKRKSFKSSCAWSQCLFFLLTAQPEKGDELQCLFLTQLHGDFLPSRIGLSCRKGVRACKDTHVEFIKCVTSMITVGRFEWGIEAFWRWHTGVSSLRKTNLYLRRDEQEQNVLEVWLFRLDVFSSRTFDWTDSALLFQSESEPINHIISMVKRKTAERNNISTKTCTVACQFSKLRGNHQMTNEEFQASLKETCKSCLRICFQVNLFKVGTVLFTCAGVNFDKLPSGFCAACCARLFSGSMVWMFHRFGHFSFKKVAFLVSKIN